MILDTNALSAFIDGNAGIGSILRHRRRAAIPVIVLGEFRYGILGSKHRKRYERWLELHVNKFEILAVTTGTTGPYAVLRAALKQLGRPIPANDAWIAALALEHALPVLSRDAHFDHVAGVERIAW